MYKDCAMLRMRMLLNSARPQPLSSDRTNVLAGPPPFMMLSGIHRGSCAASAQHQPGTAAGACSSFWPDIDKTEEPGELAHRLAAHKHHKLHILGVRLRRGRRLRVIGGATSQHAAFQKGGSKLAMQFTIWSSLTGGCCPAAYPCRMRLFPFAHTCHIR